MGPWVERPWSGNGGQSIGTTGRLRATLALGLAALVGGGCSRSCGAGTTVEALSISTVFGCAKTSTGEVLCWGSYPAVGFEADESCEDLADVPLPRGARASRSHTPASRCAMRPGRLALRDVVEVATGGGFACARTITGQISCWGMPAGGVLGWTGATGGAVMAGQSRPVPGIGEARHIAAGHNHACAVVEGGTVQCWGRNMGGQLGLGSLDRADEAHPPAAVPGLRGVTELALDAGVSCALLEDGTVQCWGTGPVGPTAERCGDGAAARPCSLRPTPVAGLADVTQIDTAAGMSCARRRDGAVLCWDEEQSSAPAAMPHSARPKKLSQLRDVRSIALLYGGLCALGADGTVACLGLNLQGQLGTGTAGGPEQLAPVTVPGIRDAVQIGAGNFNACALLRGGQAFCWGANGSGQLGDGTVTRRPAPTALAL